MVVCYRPVVLRRWFGPQLTHERLEISKNSSTLQFEGALKGIINCWQWSISVYIKINNVRGTLYLLTTSGSVPVAMVNNGLSFFPFFFFYPQSPSSCVMTLQLNVCVRRREKWISAKLIVIVNIQIITTLKKENPRYRHFDWIFNWKWLNNIYVEKA